VPCVAVLLTSKCRVVCVPFSHVVMNFFFEFLFVLFDSEVLKFGWTVSDRTKTIQATVCNHHPRTDI